MAAMGSSTKSIISISEISPQTLKTLESRDVIIYSPPTVEHWASQSYWLCNLNDTYALLISQSTVSDPEDIGTITRKANLVRKEDGKVDEERPLFIDHAKKENESKEKSHFIKMAKLSQRCFDIVFVTVKQAYVDKFPEYFILRPDFKGSSLKKDPQALFSLSATQRIKVALLCLNEYMLCHMISKQGGAVVHAYNKGDNINLYSYRDEKGRVESDVNLFNFEFAEFLHAGEGKKAQIRGHYVTMAPELYGDGQNGYLCLSADIYILAALMIQVIVRTDPFQSQSSWSPKKIVETPYDFESAEKELRQWDPLKSKKISTDIISLVKSMADKDHKKRPSIMDAHKTLNRIFLVCLEIENYLLQKGNTSREDIKKHIITFSGQNDDDLAPEKDLEHFKAHQNEWLPKEENFQSMRGYLQRIFKKNQLTIGISQNFVVNPVCNGTHRRQSAK